QEEDIDTKIRDEQERLNPNALLPYDHTLENTPSGGREPLGRHSTCRAIRIACSSSIRHLSQKNE
ncbi:unnamed protein product, partial [Dovyalis caffra]